MTAVAPPLLAAPASPVVRVPGRVTVARRAFESAFARLAAEELGVSAREVQVHVADARGDLAVRVQGPAELRGDASVLDLARAARARILADGARLSGAEIGEVRVRISGARVVETGRVR